MLRIFLSTSKPNVTPSKLLLEPWQKIWYWCLAGLYLSTGFIRSLFQGSTTGGNFRSRLCTHSTDRLGRQRDLVSIRSSWNTTNSIEQAGRSRTGA